MLSWSQRVTYGSCNGVQNVITSAFTARHLLVCTWMGNSCACSNDSACYDVRNPGQSCMHG